jgi:CRISPR/Cas system CSM-associated protein Csm3 (group 7 of RAMP superfamily)
MKMNPLIRDVARVTVELDTPVAIGSGRGGDLVDSLFVVDENDLPCLPGTSLAGVLRAAWHSAHGIGQENEADSPFGHQWKAEGRRSFVELSFGIIHGSDDRPVHPRLSPEEIERDEILRAARVPLVRQHVRINRLGTADAEEHGLYDHAVVAAGHRFTFEIQVLGAEFPGLLDELLNMIAAGRIRLGAKTRSGLGGIVPVRLQRRRFDLRRSADYEAYCRLPVGLHEPLPEGLLEDYEARPEEGGAGEVVATLCFRPVGTWLVGAGQPTENDEERWKDSGKYPDMIPFTEARVVWEGGRGRWDAHAPPLVVPASGIKGALRHRTAYHYNRLCGTFAEELTTEGLARHDGLGSSAARLLFGEALEHGSGGRQEREGSGQAGRAGCVFLNDILVPSTARQRVMHVSLDRFTSGPLDGHLFEEDVCYSGENSQEWTLKVRIREPAGKGMESEIRPEMRRALALALEDLVHGRLRIGAGAGRGHGWCRGTITWSDGGAWARGEQPRQ